MSRAGYIYPRNKPFLSTTPLGSYLAVSHGRVSLIISGTSMLPFTRPDILNLAEETF